MEKIADLAKTAGCDEFDVLGYQSFSESVEIFEQKVSNTEIQDSSALGIRLFKNNRPGIAFTERLTPEALKICLDDAISHTTITDPVEISLPGILQQATGDFNRLSDEFDRVTLQDLTRFAMEIENSARALDTRVDNVPYTGAGRSESTGYFLNSHGIEYRLKTQDFSGYSAAVATLDDQKKMGIYSNSRRNFSELKQLKIAETAVQRAVEQLGAKPVESGKYSVLFSNRVSGQIVSMYTSPFFAEMAIRGQSRLTDKLGQKIASPIFHLKSVPHDPNLPGSRARDAEGYPTRNIDVVEAGVFKIFLYNLEAAAKHKVDSTGNATRSVGSKAGTGFKNLVVTLGTQSTDALLNSGKVLFIDKLEGAAGCSPISGEMSIGAQGFLYENGIRLHPVDRITLSSNYFEMLQHIEAVGNEYNDQLSSVRVPGLLITNISVAG